MMPLAFAFLYFESAADDILSRLRRRAARFRHAFTPLLAAAFSPLISLPLFTPAEFSRRRALFERCLR